MFTLELRILKNIELMSKIVLNISSALHLSFKWVGKKIVSTFKVWFTGAELEIREKNKKDKEGLTITVN